jgi:hypothetical protein
MASQPLGASALPQGRAEKPAFFISTLLVRHSFQNSWLALAVLAWRTVPKSLVMLWTGVHVIEETTLEKSAACAVSDAAKAIAVMMSFVS